MRLAGPVALGAVLIAIGCATTVERGPTSAAEVVVFYRKPDLVRQCTAVREVSVRDGDLKHLNTTSPGTCGSAIAKLKRSAFRRGGNAIDVTSIESQLHFDPPGSEVVVKALILVCPIEVVVQANGYELPDECLVTHGITTACSGRRAGWPG